jgi:predicted phosphate transport protein (TIGR00153 family)
MRAAGSAAHFEGGSMFARLMPHEGRFFDYFSQHAALILEGAIELKAMTDNINESEGRARNIKTMENKADTITHQTIQLLHKTFITPIDRDEIHLLITRMDDILDLMEDVSQSVFLYDIRTIPVEAKRLAEICVACAEKVKAAVDLLDNMGNADRIMKICGEIDRLETDADKVLRAAMAKLFRSEPDTRELIKLKEIYEHLETVTDKCEDVANIIEGIVIENS